VAGETFAVIVGNIAHDFLVRIVTGDAADTGVGSVEAFAVREAVGLETDV